MSRIFEVEALLFVADQPASAQSIADALQCERIEVEEALRELAEILSRGSAVQLVNIAGGYQLATKPQYAEQITRFLRPQKQRLSKGLMETLAVIAYQQPMTLAELEAVRGVQCDYSVRVLLERRLIRDVGRRHTPGRPVLYGTTQQFLHYFNLRDLQELPALAVPVAQPALDFEGPAELPAPVAEALGPLATN
ncbi:MAG: SMC-Scp complex subunit ScpB [Chthonomonas sp.]|nr:SMC-Scp complex subunit ScpB [Chthonomonas sp.]